jgi:hypothetical protein
MAKPNDFKLVNQFKGYRHRLDITSLEPFLNQNEAFLVPPSQNVLFADDGTIGIREGYTLDGAANSALDPILASYDWNTSTGDELNLRYSDNDLQFRYVDSSDNVTWTTLVLDSGNLTTDAVLRFAEFWSTTELIDLLLFVDSTANIFEWSGGVTTFASATANTITKQGTTTWGAERFLTAGTRQVRVGSVTYTYTGGEGTTTLTGVTPDPTAGGHTAGDVVHQVIRTNAVSGFTRPSAFGSSQQLDLIAVLNNQVYVAATDSRYVFFSDQNSFTDYNPSSPRVPGEGGTITVDGAVVGLVSFDDLKNQISAMFVTAGKDYWYQVTFVQSESGSTNSTKETFFVKRLPTAPQMAAQSQELIGKVGNEILFISNENALVGLGNVEDQQSPKFRYLSDEVKADFDDYSFANGHLKYHKRLLHIALPAEGKDHPYNVKEGFWEAPQILPVRRFGIIANNLYLHSSAVPETYKMFDGHNDNTNPIDARAYVNYRNFGDRANYKRFDEFYSEGYISSNTELSLVLKYEFGGSESIQNFTIEGSDTSILFQTTTDGSLGKHPIGSQPIGSVTDTLDDLGKFRVIHTTTDINFFEFQVGYESNDIDFQWKVSALGPRVEIASDLPVAIKK